MTPLEKAKSNKGRVNYCDECEQFEIVGNAAYCKVDGKLIHPIMLMRGQGTGAAWNCKKRRKPLTNYERIINKSPEELAEFMGELPCCPPGADVKELCYPMDSCEGIIDLQVRCWLEWLKQQADEK